MNSSRNLKTMGSVVAIAGVCVMLFGIWKWSVAPPGDIDAGDTEAVTTRLSAVRCFVAGGVLSIAGCFCRFLFSRRVVHDSVT
jgi:drug/metabolite transporter superfamily protein YnfA